MSRAQLKASRALWRRREAFRKGRHTAALATHDDGRVAKWGGLLRDARTQIARRDAQIAAKSGPRIITAAQLGLTFQWVFGDVGELTRVYGHYTGGPRAKTREALIATARSVHAQHKNQGWGGCSYAVMIGDDGTLILMNPIGRKAAGVAGHNTGSVHVNVPGTTGDVMTDKAEKTLRWYVENAHTRRVPKAHRAPVSLRSLDGRVHSDDNATACPGSYTSSYRRIL
jgi:hypothetical protein